MTRLTRFSPRLQSPEGLLDFLIESAGQDPKVTIEVYLDRRDGGGPAALPGHRTYRRFSGEPPLVRTRWPRH